MQLVYRFNELAGYSNLFASAAHHPAALAAVLPLAMATDFPPPTYIPTNNAFPDGQIKALDLLRTQSLRWGSHDRATENWDKLCTGNCYVVGSRSAKTPFGGALKTYYRAFTSVRLASLLEQKGIRAVPLLWLDDSQDHPASCLLDMQNVPRLLPEISAVAANPAQAIPVADFESACSMFKNYLPTTAFSDQVFDIIRSCRKGDNEVDEGQLLTRLLSRFGLIVIAADESLAPIRAQLAEKLKHKSGILERQWHKRQSDLAAWDSDRTALERTSSTISPFDEQKVAAQLLPFVLFPWIGCVTGAEQIWEHGMLLGILEAMPWKGPFIVPSASLTLVELKISKIIDKFNLNLTDFQGDGEEVRRQVLSRLENLRLENRFESAEAHVHSLFQSLISKLQPEDSGLIKALEELGEKVLYQFRNLKGKQKQSWQRQSEIAEQQVEKARNYLFPLGQPQEFTLNVHYFLVRYGLQFLDAVYSQVQAFNPDHRLFPVLPESIPSPELASNEFRIDKPLPNSV